MELALHTDTQQQTYCLLLFIFLLTAYYYILLIIYLLLLLLLSVVYQLLFVDITNRVATLVFNNLPRQRIE